MKRYLTFFLLSLAQQTFADASIYNKKYSEVCPSNDGSPTCEKFRPLFVRGASNDFYITSVSYPDDELTVLDDLKIDMGEKEPDEKLAQSILDSNEVRNALGLIQGESIFKGTSLYEQPINDANDPNYRLFTFEEVVSEQSIRLLNSFVILRFEKNENDRYELVGIMSDLLKYDNFSIEPIAVMENCTKEQAIEFAKKLQSNDPEISEITYIDTYYNDDSNGLELFLTHVFHVTPSENRHGVVKLYLIDKTCKVADILHR